MLERRANPVGRAATAERAPDLAGRAQARRARSRADREFHDRAGVPATPGNRPLYLTSANGEVLARCSTEPMTDRLFRAADLINADGQPLVTVSRLKSKTPLPERVATTDLFHVVARKAQAARAYVLHVRRRRSENAAAVANVRKIYPDLKIVGQFPRLSARRCAAGQGRRNQRAGAGLSLGGARRSLRAGLCRGIHPAAFQCRRHQDLGRIVQLPVGQPGPRAAMDADGGLEWAWRIWLEPRRLFWRYLTTNPRALYLLFNKSRTPREQT